MKKIVSWIMCVLLFSVFGLWGMGLAEPEPRHKSEPDMQVHQFYAGEAAKIWPGWDGEKYMFEVTLHSAKSYEANIDTLGQEEFYYKLIVNDQWKLLDNDGKYYVEDGSKDPEIQFDVNESKITKEVCYYEPLVIMILACEKSLPKDSNLGKLVLTTSYNSYDTWEDIIQKSYDSPLIGKLYTKFNISVKRLSISGSDSYDMKHISQLEINSHIGTRLIYDIGPQEFIGTYTGKSFPDGSIHTDINRNIQFNNTYAYTENVPYSNFDEQFYFFEDEKNIWKSYVNAENDDIIEGSQEEDFWYPDFKPNAE